MRLTDTAIRSLKPNHKPYKVSDGRGLSLIVNPDQSKWWRFRYRIDGREKCLSLGTYPDVSLSLARERREEARQDVARGVDPSMKRKSEKAALADSFEAVAREWLDRNKNKFAPATYAKAVYVLEDLVFPFIGSRPIAKITPPEVLSVLRRIESQGKHETAHRTKQRAGQIFRYAIATNRAERDVTADLPEFNLSNVTHVRVESSHADKEESDEDDPETELAEADMLSVVQNVLLKGHSLLNSPVFQELKQGGFYITSITWQARNSQNASEVEFEAGFEEPEEGRGFRYYVRGVRHFDSGRYTKTLRRVDDDQKAHLFQLIEETARKILGSLDETSKTLQPSEAAI